MAVERGRDLTIVVVLSLVWGLAFVAIKSSLDLISPTTLTLLRLAVSSLLFMPYLALAGRTTAVPKAKDFPAIALIGFLGFTTYHLSLNFGEQHTTAGLASLVVATSPIFILVFSSYLLDERLTVPRSVGIVLAFAGIGVLVLANNVGSMLNATEALGALTIVPAPITAALYTVLGKPLLRRYNPIVLVAWAIFFGTAFTSVLLSPVVAEETLSMSISGWVQILYLAIFPTFIGYVLWYSLLSRSEASGIGAYLYLTTLTAIVSGVLILGEPITPTIVIGGVLVMTGVALTQRT